MWLNYVLNVTRWSAVHVKFYYVMISLYFLQKSTAPLIPNEHTPDEAKPGIAAGTQKTSSPKEEKPPSSSNPHPSSPNAVAPAVIKESAH